jgi:hypothetical protein
MVGHKGRLDVDDIEALAREGVQAAEHGSGPHHPVFGVQHHPARRDAQNAAFVGGGPPVVRRD